MAKRTAGAKTAAAAAPFQEERHAAATWHRDDAAITVDHVLRDMQQSEEPPNSQQLAFLKHFARRLKVEILEMKQRTCEASTQEPLLDLVHGFPGTGKSKVIGWMRSLMEKGLGWVHGIQFVCLAFQNAMAAQINGFTVHHWSGIPPRRGDGGASADKQKLSLKCQALRVVIIDEISMIDAELLGDLEYMIASVIRQQGTYKKRIDGTKRVFGGLNVVLCGDFWQLHPVPGTFLCSNPIDIPAGRARNALNLFWDEGPDTIRSYWPLTEVMRCRDPWYRDFLQQCRKGSLSCEMYCFFNGLPTFAAASGHCTCNDDRRDDPVLGLYKQSWRDAFCNGCMDMATYIANGECEDCKKHAGAVAAC